MHSLNILYQLISLVEIQQLYPF